jgi:antitoxin ParD1/3/4
MSNPDGNSAITTLNVSLPESMREWIQARVAAGGFSSASEYVRSLVRDDQKRAAEERLEALLLEGLESESREMTQDDWRDIRNALRERVEKRRSGG